MVWRDITYRREGDMEPDLLKDFELTEAEEAFLKDAHTWSLANINQSRVASEVYLVKMLRKMIDKITASNERIEKERNRLERRAITIASVSVVVAIVAFLGSVWILSTQLSETREFNRLSLTPHLVCERLFTPLPPKPQFGLFLTNYGTGTAVITHLEVSVDGEPFPSTGQHFKDVAQELGLLGRDLPIKFTSSVVTYLPPGYSQPLLIMDNEVYTEELGNVLEDAVRRITMHVKYESLYQETFELTMTP
jgi:hypothetical protein